MALFRESINTNASAHSRYDGLSRIITNVLEVTDPGADNPDRRRWIRWHFLYIIWWEGDRAKARAQYSGGPARGLMQLEPATFWDITQNFIFRASRRIEWLAQAAGVSVTEMDAALNAYVEKNRIWDDNLQWWRGKNSWPGGGGTETKIEDWLSNVDSFAMVMMRFHFARLGNAHTFPPASAGNLSNNPQQDVYKPEHSLGWARWWKRAFTSPGDEDRQRQNFETRGRELDGVAAGNGNGDPGGGPPPGGGTPPGNGGGKKCFIASAVYGPESWQVENLRFYRDRKLLSTTAGRLMVALYYRLSPPLADIIGRRQTLQRYVRKALDQLIKYV